jgi:hypothetical protein
VIHYTSHLMEAMRGQPNPPCEGCPQRIDCAQRQIACREFTWYVNLHGSEARGDRTPNRARYRKIFPATDEE